MPAFPTRLETERLRLEHLHPDRFDPEELYEHVRAGAPGIEPVTRYVRWEPYDDLQEAVDWVQECGSQFDSGTTATYVVRPMAGASNGEFAGLANIDPDWDRRLGTIGAWFRRECWGQGYFGEVGARFLELAFEDLDLEVVAMTHAPENENSRRAIEKLIERFGGRTEGLIRNDMVMDGEPRDSVRYSIASEEWRRAQE